jgi:hypothetical protein
MKINLGDVYGFLRGANEELENLNIAVRGKQKQLLLCVFLS